MVVQCVPCELTSDTFRMPFDLLNATKRRGSLEITAMTGIISRGEVELLVSRPTCCVRVPRDAGSRTLIRHPLASHTIT